MIALVALVVIGPEKLPKVARTAGAFFGRLQRFAMQVKDEVNRESRFAELQKLQEEVKTSLEDEVAELQNRILPMTANAPQTPASTPADISDDPPASKPKAKRQPKPRSTNAANPPAVVVPDVPSSKHEGQVELFAEAPPVAAPRRRTRKKASAAASQATVSSDAGAAQTNHPAVDAP